MEGRCACGAVRYRLTAEPLFVHCCQDVHIYTRSKLPWVALPEGVPAFEAYYDTRQLWPPASLERLDAVLAVRRSRLNAAATNPEQEN